jgi:hypothetical protein
MWYFVSPLSFTYALFDASTFELQLEELMLPIWLEQEVAELADEVELQMWLANGSNPEL